MTLQKNSRLLFSLLLLALAALTLFRAGEELFNVAWGSGNWLGLFLPKWGMLFFAFAILSVAGWGMLAWALIRPERASSALGGVGSVRERIGFLRQSFVGFLRRLAQAIRMDRFSLVQKALAALESLASQETKTVTQTLLTGALLSLLYMSATMAYGYSRVQTFQVPLEFWGILFIASLIQFISIIPFQIFGGLGVTEVSLVFLYGLFGFVQEIPAILVALRVLFYIFNLLLLAYIPLDSLFRRGNALPADEK